VKLKIKEAIKYSNMKKFHFLFHTITVQENQGFIFWTIVKLYFNISVNCNQGIDFPKVLSSCFFVVRKYAKKDFSHLQRAKSTGGFFYQGVIGGCHYFSQ
jgi:hypothetical protein